MEKPAVEQVFLFDLHYLNLFLNDAGASVSLVPTTKGSRQFSELHQNHRNSF